MKARDLAWVMNLMLWLLTSTHIAVTPHGAGSDALTTPRSTRGDRHTMSAPQSRAPHGLASSVPSQGWQPPSASAQWGQRAWVSCQHSTDAKSRGGSHQRRKGPREAASTGRAGPAVGSPPSPTSWSPPWGSGECRWCSAPSRASPPGPGPRWRSFRSSSLGCF